jgi:hypothetical protein
MTLILLIAALLAPPAVLDAEPAESAVGVCTTDDECAALCRLEGGADCDGGPEVAR